MSRLEDKVSVISGGTSSIGLAIAQRFVKEGAHVFVFARRRDALDKAVTLIGANVTAIQADASKLEDNDRVADTVRNAKGKVDVVVSNAAICARAQDVVFRRLHRRQPAQAATLLTATSSTTGRATPRKPMPSFNVRRAPPEQIAVFAQQDAYGDAGFAGVAKAIRALRHDAAALLRLNYRRNTVDIDDAVAQLRAHRPPIKAIVMVTTHRATAKFIEKTRDLYPAMIYTNVSFVGSTTLAEELRLLGPRYASGVIVTQVVPAVDSYATAILEYKSALAKFFPGQTPNYVSLEGFAAARVSVEASSSSTPRNWWTRWRGCRT
jgi:NAD(P)-dependent dehydrogenase (short-subunit alcohol dehydrogenase family)